MTRRIAHKPVARPAPVFEATLKVMKRQTDAYGSLVKKVGASLDDFRHDAQAPRRDQAPSQVPASASSGASEPKKPR